MRSVAIKRAASASTASTILAIHAGVLLRLTAAGLDYCNGGFREDSLFYPACIAISLLVLWWYCSWLVFSRGGGGFDPYVLFLSAAVLFNCGQPVLEVFGLNEIDSRNTYHVGVFLFLLALLPSILNLRDRLQMVMAAGYGSLYEQQGATGLAASTNILSYFLISGAAFIIAGGRRKPIVRMIALLSIFVSSGFEVFLGGRGEAFMPGWEWYGCGIERLIRSRDLH